MNEFSVRLPSVIFGLVSVFLVYLFFSIRGQKTLGLSTALLLAISPWHIHFSRVAFENSAYIFFLLVGLVCWTLFRKSKNIAWIITSIFMLVISFFTASAGKVMATTILLIILVSELKFFLKNKKTALLVLGSLIVISVPIIMTFQNGTLLTRYNQIPQTQTLTSAALLYSKHFSWSFLFEKGDIDQDGQSVTRHSIRGIGQLYYFQLLLIFIGLLNLKKYLSKKEIFVLLLLIAIYPIPSLLSDTQSPHSSRAIFGVLPFTFLAAVGLSSIIDWTKKKPMTIALPIFILITIIITASTIHFFQLLKKYPIYSSDFWGWQSGPKAIFEYFNQNQTTYSQFFLEPAFNGPEALISFYTVNYPQLKGKVTLSGLEPNSLCKNHLQAVTHHSLFNNQVSLESVTIQSSLYYPNGEPSFHFVSGNKTCQITE